jgi:hypothetical protein
MRPPEAYADLPATVNTDQPPEATARTHPLANLFPYFTSQSYAELKEDIRRHGVRLPIFVTVDGLILDGRHREQAARELGIECPRIVVDETRPESLLAIVTSMNVYRRHLSPGQLAAWFERVQRQCPTMAAQFLDVTQVAATAAVAKRSNLKQGTARKPNVRLSGKTAAAKAKVLNVSRATVEQVVRVAREVPHRLQEIESGEASANKILAETAAGKRMVAPVHAEDATPGRVTDQMLGDELDLFLNKIGKTPRVSELFEFAGNARRMFQRASARERKALSRYLQVLIEWSCQPREALREVSK